MSLVGAVARSYRKRWQRWLDRRIPVQPHVVLDQRRVFIFISRQGMLLAAALVALFIGGLNYGNNLLLGMAFLLGSLMVVSIFHTFRNLSGLAITAQSTEPAFAGESAAFCLRFESHARRTHESLQLQWSGVEERVDLVDGDNPVTVTMWLPTRYRGRFHPPRLKIETVYPLGVFRAWTWIDPGLQAVVWPKPLSSELIPQGEGDEGEGLRRKVQGREDFDGLRGFVPGDPLQHVSWKHFARGQGLQSKLFSAEAASSEYLDWDYFQGMDREARLSRLAWWVEQLSVQQRVFGLRLPGLEIAPATGSAHRLECLNALGLFEAEIFR